MGNEIENGCISCYYYDSVPLSHGPHWVEIKKLYSSPRSIKHLVLFSSYYHIHLISIRLCRSVLPSYTVITLPCLESHDNEVLIPIKGNWCPEVQPSSHQAAKQPLWHRTKACSSALQSCSIWTGWYTFQRTQAFEVLTFALSVVSGWPVYGTQVKGHTLLKI